MKKILFVALIAAFILSTCSVALANYGVHASPEKTAAPFFAADTDGCAGCHRAHTGVGARLAFAIGPAQPIAESNVSVGSPSAFCLVCHAFPSTLSNTDVINGVTMAAVGASPAGATLSGGGFNKLGGTNGQTATSIHKVEATMTAWGGGTSGDDDQSAQMTLTCGDCHDPHGAYNYRLLNTGPLGDGGTPLYKVESLETGWHTTNYVPDYTQDGSTNHPYRYKKGADANQGISAHCWKCHTKYKAAAGAGSTGQGKYKAMTYNPSNNTYELQDLTRFRHPVNIPVDRYGGTGGLFPDKPELNVSAVTLPLEKESPGPNSLSDWIGCITCHRAHGTAATMTATAKVPPTYKEDQEGKPVPGFYGSALLRLNNRGVCENCHQK